MQEKLIQVVGWIAAITAVIMFLAYIDQIRLNLHGNKGSAIQPAATVLNCVFWATYGGARKKKGWPIIIANLPGIILGTIALLTAL